MAEERSDEALMLAYRDGDAAAFEALYRRYRGRLYRYLLHQCGAASIAEDLYQDVWIKVVGARRGYEVAARFSTWLFRIAHNRLIDHYRAHARSLLASYDDADRLDEVVESLPEPASERPDVRLERRQLAERLVGAIDALPPPQREAFLMSEEGELSLDEIAAATGVNRETAKSRLRYALAKLRAALEEETAR
jgi:RNA polymerase sigma-70 factor (ECF subfamily)